MAGCRGRSSRAPAGGLELAVDLATHGLIPQASLSWNQIYPFLQSVADLQKITHWFLSAPVKAIPYSGLRLGLRYTSVWNFDICLFRPLIW